MSGLEWRAWSGSASAPKCRRKTSDSTRTLRLRLRMLLPRALVALPLAIGAEEGCK